MDIKEGMRRIAHLLNFRKCAYHIKKIETPKTRVNLKIYPNNIQITW
jgi:hypothetical protein